MALKSHVYKCEPNPKTKQPQQLLDGFTRSYQSLREWRCSLEPQYRESWQFKASIGHVVRFCLKKQSKELVKWCKERRDSRKLSFNRQPPQHTHTHTHTHTQSIEHIKQKKQPVREMPPPSFCTELNGNPVL